MQIVRTQRYLNSLENTMRYIACDSKTKALAFRRELDKHIALLEDFPYKFRRSIYFDDEQIRDLIFKGYTIPYRVDEANDRIVILGMKKYTEALP